MYSIMTHDNIFNIVYRY